MATSNGATTGNKGNGQQSAFIEKMVPKVGLEPTRDILPPVFETGASTIPPLRPSDFSIARLRLSPAGV